MKSWAVGTMTRVLPPHVVNSARISARDLRARARSTVGRGSLPSFLIIGGQRCGTTSLYRDLALHPQVVEPLGKELQYFSVFYDRGLDWYRGLFPELAPGRVTFEASPYYLFNSQVPARVAEQLPHARVVALLRDPAERAYSHYLHTQRFGHETLSFVEALDAEPERLARAERRGTSPAEAHSILRHYSYVSRGRYAEQLERWFSTIPREQIHVMRSEEFYQRPEEEFLRLLGFLELDRFVPPTFVKHTKRSDSTRETQLTPALRERIMAELEPDTRRLPGLLGWDATW